MSFLQELFRAIHINWLDLFLGLTFLVIIVRGFLTGFSRTASSLVGVLAGFWAAVNHYEFVARQLAVFMSNEVGRKLLAFFLIFLVVYLCFVIAGILIYGFFKALHLSWFDKVLGGAFGFLKAALITGVIIFILTLTLPENNSLIRNSYLYPRVSSLARLMTSMVPDHIKGQFMWKWRRTRMHFQKGRREAI